MPGQEFTQKNNIFFLNHINLIYNNLNDLLKIISIIFNTMYCMVLVFIHIFVLQTTMQKKVQDKEKFYKKCNEIKIQAS